MIDVSVLKKGDQYYNQEEGWVTIDRVEYHGGFWKLRCSKGGTLSAHRDGSNYYHLSMFDIKKVNTSGGVVTMLADKQDMVNSPSHYQLVNGLEVKDVRKAIFDKIPMGKLSYHQADCYSRAWEYLTRACFKHESPLEDLQKAQTYLNWIIEDLSVQSTVDKSAIRGSQSTTKQTGEVQ